MIGDNSIEIVLDPDLLLTPFRVQTNWYVITGTASSGKSTLIGQLADRGFQTVPETARLYIEKEMAKGRTAQEIHANGAALQRGMKDLQLEVERNIRISDVTFLDRGVPDFLAWYRVRGLNPNEILTDCFHHRYASVFMLDPLPFQPDDQRIAEIAAVAKYLDKWHTRDYQALGYNVVRVPVLPPEERLEFVLERLSDPAPPNHSQDYL
jgi:predicted ATPase